MWHLVLKCGPTRPEVTSPGYVPRGRGSLSAGTCSPPARPVTTSAATTSNGAMPSAPNIPSPTRTTPLPGHPSIDHLNVGIFPSGDRTQPTDNIISKPEQSAPRWGP